MTDAVKDDPLYPDAVRHVKELRGFYGHAFTYALVVGGLAVLDALTSPGRWWVQWVAFGWGIGLVAHGASLVASGSFFGHAWEERKVREYLERARSR